MLPLSARLKNKKIEEISIVVPVRTITTPDK
jgi:hypothetical protein